VTQVLDAGGLVQSLSSQHSPAGIQAPPQQLSPLGQQPSPQAVNSQTQASDWQTWLAPQQLSPQGVPEAQAAAQVLVAASRHVAPPVQQRSPQARPPWTALQPVRETAVWQLSQGTPGLGMLSNQHWLPIQQALLHAPSQQSPPAQAWPSAATLGDQAVVLTPGRQDLQGFAGSASSPR
jgi:hypothetical protein